MTAPLLSERDSRGIATLTLNRPELHNAFDDRLIAELRAELQRLEAIPEIRVVVLAARGSSFSAGADLNWMRRMAGYSKAENLADACCLAELMHTLNNLAKPTVARVQGPVFGGGVGLVACCDIAIAAETAVFALSEVKLGLIPAVISPYVVNAIGERQARRYFVTGERFAAHQAQRLGLVHEVVSSDTLDTALDKLLQAMLANGPGAMVAAKTLAQTVSRTPIDATLREDTARRIAKIRASDEAREGLSAFLEKRSPAWSGG